MFTLRHGVNSGFNQTPEIKVFKLHFQMTFKSIQQFFHFLQNMLIFSVYIDHIFLALSFVTNFIEQICKFQKGQYFSLSLILYTQTLNSVYFLSQKRLIFYLVLFSIHSSFSRGY
jgi:hypothetical protein